MTDETDSSTVPQGDADQERWLTYLNYDQAVKQAVRRLGALSAENVDVFRSLLMKGRDRTRVAEYEAESVRRLQGEAFVGDEELQRTLIVLHAEDPHLAEEFKRVVAATGKPQELDQTIAAIRSKTAPVQPVKIRLVETPRPEVVEPKKGEKKIEELPRQVVLPEPTPRQEPSPVRARMTTSRPAAEPVEPAGSRKGLAIAAALLLVAVAGLAVLWPRPDDGAKPVQTAAAPQPVAADPTPSPASSPAPVEPPAAAPAAEVAMPAQNDKPPEIRPASDAPDKISPDKAANASEPRSAPVPGAYYKVVAGDMLSEIAVRAYRDASKFLIIQRANPSLRASADRILVDQVIFIPRAP